VSQGLFLIEIVDKRRNSGVKVNQTEIL